VYGKSLDFYSRALGIYESFYGEKHEMCIKMYQYMGSLHKAASDWQKAIQCYQMEVMLTT
jgi:hypothetical protein